jgi:phage protein D
VGKLNLHKVSPAKVNQAKVSKASSKRKAEVSQGKASKRKASKRKEEASLADPTKVSGAAKGAPELKSLRAAGTRLRRTTGAET